MVKVVSLTAARAAQTGNAADWTPTDVLKDILNKIEAGDIHPNNLIVCFTEDNPVYGLTDVRYSVSCPNIIVSTGLLHRAVHLMGTDNEV